MPDEKKKRGVDTVITHTGLDPEGNHGIPNPPVYYASTILFPTTDEFATRDRPPFQGVQYGRSGTPTQFAFEAAVTALHDGHKTVSFPSGAAAVTTALMTFLRHGDHLLMVDTVYGPTRKRTCDQLLARMGVDVTFYDPLIGAGIDALIRPETKVIFLESPGSQTFEMQDVPAICDAARDTAKARGLITIMDNTWSSPLYCQPLKLGVDVVAEASTKYVVGHSDAMLGTVTVKTEAHYQDVRTMANTLGTRAGPDECFLGLRGLRTLSVRLERHQKNALQVAEWLQERAEVQEVLYPALPDDPGHTLWSRDHSGASGLFGVVLEDVSKAAVDAMLNDLELFGIGASWGGFESLAIPTNPGRLRTATTWRHTSPCIRLHIGLEDPEDLIADLAAGFERLNSIG